MRTSLRATIAIATALGVLLIAAVAGAGTAPLRTPGAPWRTEPGAAPQRCASKGSPIATTRPASRTATRCPAGTVEATRPAPASPGAAASPTSLPAVWRSPRETARTGRCRTPPAPATSPSRPSRSRRSWNPRRGCRTSPHDRSTPRPRTGTAARSRSTSGPASSRARCSTTWTWRTATVPSRSPCTRAATSPAGDDVACIEIAVLKRVVVPLDEPLGDRRIVDGASDEGEPAA